MASAAQPLPVTDETVLVVPAMHCAGCMGKVESGLERVPGVVSARVNLTAKQVRVVHVAGVSVPELVSALSQVGFTSQVRSGDSVPPPSAARKLLPPLAVAGFAAMNVMLLSVSIWSGADGPTRSLFHWISALIAVPAIAFSGRPFFSSAWSALRQGRTNMDVPISIGVTLATGLSLYETMSGGHVAWFDGTLMLLLFLLAGRTLDAAMRDRARAGVDALLRQAAPGALVVGKGGALTWFPATQLVPNMVMRVAAGERLAADGIIVTGMSRFDRSLLTGESTPIHAAMGDQVHAGTLNIDAPVDVRVSAAGTNTSLAEIAALMDVAGQSRSAYVRIADRASRYYAPAVHTLALVSFIGWMIAGAGLHQSLVIAIAVLIITCPCALGLAVPVAQVVASGTLMRSGVMVKDGSAIERLAKVDRALLDKTGTLTLGRPTPDPVVLASLPDDAASVALGLASHSHHPLSRGLADVLAKAGHRAAELDQVEERPGEGLTALWLGRKVALRRPEVGYGMAASLCIADRPTVLIPFADRLRPDAGTAIGALKDMGIDISILSGDNGPSVAVVARETGLFAQSSALPVDKLEAIRVAQRTGHCVLMVGDGLNDGPALAAADASMAPGTASDVGRQAADFVFLGDSLIALPRAIDVTRRTMLIVRQNFVLAIGYNALAVPLAIMGLVTPLLAAAAMSTSSLIVIANSLRLARAAR